MIDDVTVSSWLVPLAGESTAAVGGGPVRTAVTAGLVLVGVFFLSVGVVGLVRLPDVYNRMHATSKASTLGAASIFLAGGVHFNFEGAGLVSLVGILFLFLTAPTGAHMISRAAHRLGVQFYGDVSWPGDEPARGEPEVVADSED